MYRRKTVEAIQRNHQRELARRDEMISNLLDRIMLLAGTPWTPPPEGEQIEAEPLPSFDWSPEASIDAAFAEAE